MNILEKSALAALGVVIGSALSNITFAKPTYSSLAYATIESSIEWKVRGEKPERLEHVTPNISDPISYCSFLDMLSFKGDRSHYVIVKCRVVEWYKDEI